ncbi:hypothetical protein ES707_09214 [subsurface metagenome]
MGDNSGVLLRGDSEVTCGNLTEGEVTKQQGKVEGKSSLIMALGLALTITGGAFAYTWTTGGLTIGISEPTGDIATVNATATQPDWDDVLVPVPDTIIYRPDTAGDKTDIADQFPAAGDHWDKVDEATSDNDTTYIATDDGKRKKDLYNIPDYSTLTAAGDIDGIEVYMVARAVSTPTDTSGHILILTNGKEHKGGDETVTTAYATYSYPWDTNPETTNAWTWDEIDALQIGVDIRDAADGIPTRCTQNYVEVEFEAPPLTGSTPAGDLFEVTAHDDYSGALQVRVYLVNTDSVMKAYQQLDMRLYLEGSVEAGETPNYQLLNMTNGVVVFNLVGISGGSYTLSVTGGDYTLNSREPGEWEEGYAVTPELYCEVAQR